MSIDILTKKFLINHDDEYELLNVVVDNRTLKFEEIQKHVQVDNRERLKNALDSLEKVKLVESIKSTVPGLSKYYPTAKGLEASRMLRR